MSSKPIVFFSHSSRDKRELSLLKRLFVEKTGGAIEVFLSSDGQSIPLGRNWIHRIEEALESAKLLVTFITGNSVGSSWVSFEAGFAYSKGVQVVPVGFLGLDVANVPPPIGLLQGFNITSADGLDNLIALVNDTLSHNHTNRFTNEEYGQIVELGQDIAPSSVFQRLVDEIEIHLNDCRPENTKLVQAIKPAAELFGTNISYGLNERSDFAWVHFPGGSLQVYGPNRKDYKSKLTIDPIVFVMHTRKLDTLVRNLGGNQIGTDIYVKFSPLIEGHDRKYKVSALLANANVRIEKNNLVYKTLRFNLRKASSAMYLDIKHSESTYPAEDVRALVELLAEHAVIWVADSIFA